MKKFTLALVVCAGLLGACSQLSEVSPELEPQFGTRYSDSAEAVARDNARNRTYVLGLEAGRDEGYGGAFECRVMLRRFDGPGNLTWAKRLAVCPGRDDFPNNFGLDVDGAGNVYAGFSWTTMDAHYGARIEKYAASGTLLKRIYLPGGSGEALIDFDVDARGHIIAASELISDEFGPLAYFLQKFDRAGKKVWERSVRYSPVDGMIGPVTAVAEPFAVALADDGTVFEVGRAIKGTSGAVITRYAPEGQVIWQKPIGIQRVAESALDVRDGDVYLVSAFALDENWETRAVRVQKYGLGGRKLWERSLPASLELTIGDISADSGGNLYLAGAWNTGSNPQLYIRKYSASGSVSWTRQTSAASPRRAHTDVVTGNRGVYLTAYTEGKVNGTNKGGQDAFVEHIDSRGKTLWTR